MPPDKTSRSRVPPIHDHHPAWKQKRLGAPRAICYSEGVPPQKDADLMVLVGLAAKSLRDAGAREIYLFGSVAEGKWSEYSDVDMAVTGLPPVVFYRAMSRASDILQRPLDLVDLDDPNPFTEYLERKGKLKRVA